MNLRYQAIFQVVCDEMNMTRAAKRLNMSQPAISQVIKDIERHFDLKMFERVGKQLYITEAGKVLLGYSDQLMAVHDAMEVGMEALLSRDLFRLHVSQELATQEISLWLATYKKQEDQRTVRLKTLPHQSLVESLLSHQCDVALVDEVVERADLTCTMLREEPWVVIGPSALKMTMAPVPLIINRLETGMSSRLIALLNKRKVTYEIVAEYESLMGVLESVNQGLGWGIVPKSLYGLMSAQFSHIKVEEELIQKIYGLSLKDKKNDFIQFVIEGTCDKID